AGLLAVAGVIAAVVVLGAPRLLPKLDPFPTETKDRPQPALLQSLQRLDSYHAARANLQQVVDVEQDTKRVPSFLKGERTVMVARATLERTLASGRPGPESGQASGELRELVTTLPAHASAARTSTSPARASSSTTAG